MFDEELRSLLKQSETRKRLLNRAHNTDFCNVRGKNNVNIPALFHDPDHPGLVVESSRTAKTD